MAFMHDFPATLKILTVWLLLGVLVFLGFQALERHRHRSLVRISGEAIEIARGPDGHFHWPGHVNGRPVDFLVDTGATITVLPLALAEELELPLEGRVSSRTAGGVVSGSLARADISLQGGITARGLRVAVLPQLQAPLLGMDVLARLRWSQHGGMLRVEPPGASSSALDRQNAS